MESVTWFTIWLAGFAIVAIVLAIWSEGFKAQDGSGAVTFLSAFFFLLLAALWPLTVVTGVYGILMAVLGDKCGIEW